MPSNAPNRSRRLTVIKDSPQRADDIMVSILDHIDAVGRVHPVLCGKVRIERRSGLPLVAFSGNDLHMLFFVHFSIFTPNPGIGSLNSGIPIVLHGLKDGLYPFLIIWILHEPLS